MVGRIGADRVVDYTREDVTKSGQRYDLILDNVGNHSLSACKRVLNRKRRLRHLWRTQEPYWISSNSYDCGSCVVAVHEPEVCHVHSEDEQRRSGHHGPVDSNWTGKTCIDKRYRLGQASEAIRYLEQGHARGKVVMTLES
jgi:NADPH:quinone reductase-like Zn-dependent oxidoreductase